MLNYLPKGSSEPGFTTKNVRWVIVFGSEGDFLEVLDLADPNDKKKRGRSFEKCPDLSQPELVGGSESRCHYLIETASVVTQFNKDNETDKNIEKSREKHNFFTRILRDSSTIFPFFEKIANTLSNEVHRIQIQAQLREKKAKPSDSITVAIKNDSGFFFPVESDIWHDWWRTFRSSLGKPVEGSSDPNKMISVISGQAIDPLPSNPTIKGLSSVGGLATGDRLISFNKEAFCSYGLQESLNCAVSESEAYQYRDSLNGLIQENGRKIGGALVIPWFKKPIPDEDDPFQFLIEPGDNEERIARRKASELLESIHTGKRSDLLNNTYYALTLSGASGRVMVRDWMEGSFESLVQNIERWFDDFTITRNDGSGVEPDPKFMRIVFGIASEAQDLPAPHITQLWRCAVRGSPIPVSFLARSVERFRVTVIKDEYQNPTRLGLMKAYHNRKNGGIPMSAYLNENHPHPAYHCGRLMAILAELQRSALGDVGAGIVQRFYAAASCTPSLILGRLIRMSQFHLSKLEGKGLAYWYESRIADIVSQIGDRIPTSLDLEAQSFFALGYYQQIAANRTPKTDNHHTDTEE